jgi:1-deoxy-D-xylulose-5-phosphate synthase
MAVGSAIVRTRSFHVAALIGDLKLAGAWRWRRSTKRHLKSRLIVLLNDNGMSIAPAVGSLTGYASYRIKKTQSYQHWKEEIGDALSRSVPGIPAAKLACGREIGEGRDRCRCLPARWSNELGFKYIGLWSTAATMSRSLVAATRSKPRRSTTAR